jgi:hypothetical protein
MFREDRRAVHPNFGNETLHMVQKRRESCVIGKKIASLNEEPNRDLQCCMKVNEKDYFPHLD